MIVRVIYASSVSSYRIFVSSLKGLGAAEYSIKEDNGSRCLFGEGNTSGEVGGAGCGDPVETEELSIEAAPFSNAIMANPVLPQESMRNCVRESPVSSGTGFKTWKVRCPRVLATVIPCTKSA